MAEGPERREEPRIVVIGSARLTSGDPAYQLALELGRRLGEAGAVVVTGGYGGLMGAVSRGARDVGARVVGLPMAAWSHLTPNEWNVELVWATGYPERLASMLECDAVIALDGGVGTLSELALMWSAAQTEASSPRVVAMGERWRRILDGLSSHLVIDRDDLALLTWVAGPEEAVRAALEAPGRARTRTRQAGG